MTKWEYLIENYTLGLMPSTAQKLNALGKAGWELVSVVQDNDGFTTVVFKRPIN